MVLDKSLFTKYVRIEGGETREEKREEFSKEWKELLRKRDTQHRRGLESVQSFVIEFTKRGSNEERNDAEADLR